MIKVRPHVMLHGGVVPKAIALWQRAFPELTATPPEPPAMLWELCLGDQSLTLFDSPEPHDFAPTPSWSMMVDLASPEDVDRVAGILSEGGMQLMPPGAYPFATRFAWVEDRFKLSWQLRYAEPTG